jgi:IS30 family transposase
LQRDKSSVSREIKRNTNTEGIYSPSYAQKQYEIRRRKCGRKPLLLNADIHKTVQFLFLQYQWSPEQISFRLKHEKNPIQISYATIYRGIYQGFLEEGKLSPGQRGVARKLRQNQT